MKKVKIFLGISCLTVALASVAFTKANAKFVDPEYYLTTTSQCIQIEIPTNCDPNLTVPCTVTESATEVNRPVFQVKNPETGACETQLFKAQ